MGARNNNCYLLIEFQSTVDKYMSLRVLRYIGEFYESILQHLKGKKLPPVFPLMLYGSMHRKGIAVQCFDPDLKPGLRFPTYRTGGMTLRVFKGHSDTPYLRLRHWLTRDCRALLHRSGLLEYARRFTISICRCIPQRAAPGIVCNVHIGACGDKSP
jgi:hypothetical protein